MKLIRQDKRYRYYRLSDQDLRLWLFALGHYPFPCAKRPGISRSGEGDSIEEADELLKSALAAQRRKTKSDLRRWLRAPNRITDADGDIQLRIEQSRREWLLQILNDIRVGAWNQLGAPDQLEDAYQNLTANSGRLVFLMEIAGMFQSALLLDGDE
ncbi:MAG TPA: hypothetical protein DCY13_05165 [Verrucomicrobiales bacterium]|nr:hypothetical protein [Verrucomicrobiales bacterium]